MSTQGEQILKQLRRYEDGKRDCVYSSSSNGGGGGGGLSSASVSAVGLNRVGSTEANEDELLNSQLELMQLATSPGTMVQQQQPLSYRPSTGTNDDGDDGHDVLRRTARTNRHYTSLKILASEPRYFPPLNFGVVESDLYRCGHPQSINYPFLESLKLRTIIYVGDKTNSWEYYRWIKSQPREIAFLHVPLDLAATANNDDKLNYLLSIVAHSANYPILIHSNKGKHRVGVVVALIRKILQGWVLAAVYDEYGKYAKHGKDNSELQFIEFFQSHVPVPAVSQCATDASVDASVPRFIDVSLQLPSPHIPNRAR